MASIAELFVTVMPETSKIADGIVRAFREVDPKATEAGRRWGREIQRGLGDTTVDLKADTTAAKAEIDEAARDRKSTVKVDVDRADLSKAEAAIQRLSDRQADASGKARLAKEVLAEAESRYQELQEKGFAKDSQRIRAEESVARAHRNSTSADRLASDLSDRIVKLKVEAADTAKAKAEIDEAARDRRTTIHVNVDKDRFGQTVQNELAQMGTRMSGQAASSGASIGSSMGAALAPALMTAGIAALAGIASAASGMLGLIPAGLAGAGSVIGTLAVGLDGVKDAWDAAGKAADASGKDQEAKTKAVADAQKSLKDAVIDEAMAQKDVANARKDARQQLEDLNVQLRGGVIDEKQAVLDAAAARRDLMTGRFKDSIEYQQAQLRVQQADQRVLESHERQVLLQRKASEANAQGVEGSDRVVAANQRLEKAHDSVAAAQRNLSDAQTKTSSAADTAATAMAKLSPVAQQFVGTLLQMKPLWEGFKNSVQDALFANMGPQIRQLATTYMPMLHGSFTTMASLINQAATQFMRFMERPESMMLMQTLLNNINTSFQAFLPTIQTLTGAFLQMTATGSSFLPQLGQIFGQLANMFAGFVNSGQFSQWMQTGLLTLQQLTNMLPTVLQMFTALAPIGTAALGALSTVLTALQPAIAPLSNLFAAMVNELAPWWGFLVQIASTIVASLAPAFTQLLNAMTPMVQQVVNALQPALQTLGPVLVQTAQVLLAALIPAVGQMIPVVVPLAQSIAQWYIAMLPLLPSLMQLATNAIPPITGALTVLLPALTKVLQIFTNLATTIVPVLSQVFSGLADNYTRVWNAIGTVTETVWNKIKPILDLFKNAIHDLHIDDLLKALDLVNGGSQGGGGLDQIGKTPPGGPLDQIGKTPPAAPGAPLPKLSQLRPGFNWDAVLPHEGVTWDNADTGHNGHYGGLQFSPDTWADYGGLEFAPRADLATPEQQKMVADRVAFTGWNGRKPQGLGAWEAITKGLVPGITPSTPPPAAIPTPAPGTGAGAGAGAPALPALPSGGVPMPSAAGGLGGLNFGQLPNVKGAHQQLAYALAAVQQMFPGLTLTAGKDDHPMDQGWHPKGQAIDIGGGTPQQQAQAANWLLQFAPEIEELIHSGPGVTQNIKSGRLGPAIDMPGSVYNSGQAGYHGDHVHLAVTDQMAQAFVAALSGGGAGGAFPSAAMPTAALPGGVSADGIPLGTQTSPMYVTPASGAEQLGKDFVSGIGEVFGFDGSLFKNPLDSGLFKGFKGLMSGLTGGGKGGGKGGQGMPGWMWGAMGGDGAALPGGGVGGGGDIFGGLLSAFMPKPFGQSIIGGPAKAPDEYQPLLPGSGGNTGLPGPKPAGPAGLKTAGGPTVDQSISFYGPVGNPIAAGQMASGFNLDRARQGLTGLLG